MATPTPTESHEWPPAGALTTIYTPPAASCSSDPGKFRKVACMPPSWESYDYSLSYYSPAICPSGYASACTRQPTANSEIFGPPMIVSETAIICCPSSYTCRSDEGYLYCDSGNMYTTTDVRYLLSQVDSTNWVSQTVMTKMILPDVAYAIQVRWQESDLKNFQTLPPGATIAHSTPSASELTQAVRMTSEPTNTAAPSTPSPGLPTITKIGIGVIVPFATIIFLICVLLLFLRFRGRKWKKPPSSEKEKGGVFGLPQPIGYPLYVLGTSLFHGITAYKPGHIITSTPIQQHQQSPVDSGQINTIQYTSTPPFHIQSPGINTPTSATIMPPTQILGQQQQQQQQQRGNDSSTTLSSSHRDTLTRLQEEQALLQERKCRIIQLQHLDEEEHRLRRLISQARRVIRIRNSNAVANVHELNA